VTSPLYSTLAIAALGYSGPESQIQWPMTSHVAFPRNNVTAAILKVWHRIQNLTPSIYT